MRSIFNDDFQDFIEAFNHHKVEYVLVGGYSVTLHGYSRTTGDLGIWVNKKAGNYDRITQAFLLFGMLLFDMTENNFLRNPDFNVFSFGRAPVSIDLMTEVKGLSFGETFKGSQMIEVGNLFVHLIHYQDLVKAKMSSGRSKDHDDLENLREGK